MGSVQVHRQRCVDDRKGPNVEFVVELSNGRTIKISGDDREKIRQAVASSKSGADMQLHQWVNVGNLDGGAQVLVATQAIVLLT